MALVKIPDSDGAEGEWFNPDYVYRIAVDGQIVKIYECRDKNYRYWNLPSDAAAQEFAQQVVDAINGVSRPDPGVKYGHDTPPADDERLYTA
jgi:hypothetical protein